MRDLFVTAIVFSALPVTLARPYIGILVWTWLSLMNPHRLTWSYAYDFPFAQLIAVAVLAGVVISREPRRIPWTPVTVALALFILWMNVTTLFALYPSAALWEWKRMMKGMVMLFIALMVLYDKKRINLMVWVIVASVGFFAIKGGLFVFFTQGRYMVFGPEGTFIEDNTTIGLALVMLLPLMRYLQITTVNKWLRLGLIGAMVLTALAFIGSYSRGALVGGAAMIAFLWLKSRNKAVLGVVLLLLSPFLIMFMPDQWFDKMSTITNYEHDASARGRINAWTFATNVALDRPLVGGGFNTFTPELFHVYAPVPESFHDAHSIYFEALGEHGFVGLFLFLIFWFLVWRTGSWIIRHAKKDDSLRWAVDLAAMIQVSLAGFAVGGAFLGLAYWDMPYYLAIILVLTRVLVEKSLAQAVVPKTHNEIKTQGALLPGFRPPGRPV